MLTSILGYPRIGSQRELKKACENYWAGKIDESQLQSEATLLRKQNWTLQKEAGIDLIPSNDFSFYDQVLDMTLALGAIPSRYAPLTTNRLDLYFAMARGYQRDGHDIIAMEMTKWFDTNYHYIVPEFKKGQQFKLFYNKASYEYNEAQELGIETKPVIIGPITYLLLGKEKEAGFHRLDLLDNLLPAYIELLRELEVSGAKWVQLDEPFLALDINKEVREAYEKAYQQISASCPALQLIVATYFEGLKDNLSLAVNLPVDALHIDVVRAPQQLDEVLNALPASKKLSVGVVDGRNIWKNDLEKSRELIQKAVNALGEERVIIAGSSSFLHVPCDLDLEKNEKVLTAEIKQWMAFAKQKVHELVALKELCRKNIPESALPALVLSNIVAMNRTNSTLIHNPIVKEAVSRITEKDELRDHPFATRCKKQHEALGLPLYPTTTIGSFPQTKEVRSWRARFKKNELTETEYGFLLRSEIEKTVKWQESIGLDVLVHGEFERNDMVEYFGEQLSGFTFTQNGWVQSYGSRCVKPPVIYGDVSRPHPMTVEWSTYAQSLTGKLMKGMLTGPVTILQWSFVRDDQPRSETCRQIALAIRQEVADLEKVGIKVIQIDEPAFREGLPLRREDWNTYLDWAVQCFCLSAATVKDETQIHTHMCYSEFNDIIEYIAKMDADVITIECSRSQMELLDAFVKFSYPNEIGPGVYDIHSPRVPSVDEMVALMKKAVKVIPPAQLWVNPDCGLKTRGWEETKEALSRMVEAARILRKEVV